MPFVFIHGVNTRDGGPESKWGQMKREIEANLRERVLDPLHLELDMIWPNWGQYAVSFSWYEKGYGLLTIPTMGVFESLRSAPQESSAQQVEAVKAELETLDLGAMSSAEREQLTGALLGALAQPGLSAALLQAPSEVEAAQLLEQALSQQPGQEGPAGTYESLGGAAALLSGAGNRLLRVATTIVVRGRRQAAQRNASRFMADAFVYARDRGTREQPGKIIQEVLAALRAPRAPGEPLIVMTHSMGGNILYDILTTYAPELEVDTWIAVGSQVGHFEDMKLFCASDPAIAHPHKVPKPKNVKHWFNLLDRGDVIAFLAEPVFEGANDVFFATGESALTAHGAYFHQPDFYKLVAELLAKPDVKPAPAKPLLPRMVAAAQRIPTALAPPVRSAAKVSPVELQQILADKRIQQEFLDTFDDIARRTGLQRDAGFESLNTSGKGPSKDEAVRALESMAQGTWDGRDGWLEAIVKRFGRPVLLVQQGTFQPSADGHPESMELISALEKQRAKLDAAIAGVGRIDLRNHQLDWVGTGWLVSKDVVVTNRHVAQEFAVASGSGFAFRQNGPSRKMHASIDLLHEYLNSDEARASVTKVLWIEPDDGFDLALLQISPTTDAQTALPAPIEFLSAQDIAAEGLTDRLVAAIGYPAYDSRNNAADQQRIFDGIYNVKRLAPGRIVSFTPQGLLTHNCTTLGGNSGCLILDVESGKAAGLHFGGVEGERNWAVQSSEVNKILRMHAL